MTAAILSEIVTLPATRRHPASRAEVSWHPDTGGWTAREIGTTRTTAKWRSEEDAIRAARRREWSATN